MYPLKSYLLTNIGNFVENYGITLSAFRIAISLFLTKLLSALTSSFESFFSEMLKACLNGVYALSQSLLLTSSLLRLLTSKLLISLNSISKGTKNSEY